MALYLLGKTNFHSSEEFAIDGRSIYDQYGRLTQILEKYCPFIYLAEPTITFNNDPDDSFISWYADTKVEPIFPVESQQDFIKQRLSDAITILFQAYPQGSKENTLLNAVFHVQDQQDILIADDKIVLKGWGIKRANHDNGTQGLSLFSSLQPLSKAESISNLDSKPDESIKNQANNINSSSANTIFKIPKRSIGIGGVPIFFTRLIVAILFFIIGVLLGWRVLYAERPIKIAKLPVIEAQDLVRKKPEIDQKNKNIEDEIKKIEEQLKHPPCDLSKNRAVPELNNSLDNSSAPMKSNGTNFQGSLPELLEKSTVFILVKTKDQDGEDAIAAGSGFFVTPDIIVTNRHVVEGADGNSVLVTNKTLGQFKKAHILSISDHSSDINSFDLAVLKIEDAPPQQPLSFSLDAQPLQTVVAAGYPGMIIRQDGALKRLAQGDVNAIPGVILTKGEINAIQENDKGQKIMPHSAAVSPGNSGGELVDLCGRVVGVNTFVTMDSETSSHSNYAQKSDSIVQALQGANIPIQVQSGTCKNGITDESGGNKNQPETSNSKSDQPSISHGETP